MALVLADRVLETTTTAGSGTITLVGAEPGYQSFSAVGDGNQTYYTITADTDWEVGIGTYTASGTTLSRDTVLSSSNSNAKVTFPAGVKKVFVTYPSEKSVNLDVSGNISLSSAVISGVGYPSVASDAATKSYVDNMSAAALHIHDPVVLATPASTGRNDTYNNGTAGVSATLTATANGTLTIDSTVAQAAQRVLIKDCDDQVENGIYVVTTVGDGSNPYVMTRSSDADTYGEQGANSLDEGSYFYVSGGTSLKGAAFVCNTPGVITFGSTNITFAEFSQTQVYTAGTGISLTNTVISLVSPVAVATGGTGTTATPTNGQLLIGNGTNYTLSTLTAGSGVSITNSAGSITLSATGTGGTVVAVTATAPLASTGGVSPNISIANSTGTGSVVLDQGATISSATITAGVSASITTITGSSANITTVSGTTARFSSAAITQLSGTSAGITTVSGTTTTFSSGTITQFGATSATIATVSGTNVTYSNGNFTSATVTTVSGTTATYTSATVTNLALTSLTITSLSITNLAASSATITTGNLAFSGTAQRITGDMSNATIASRLAFQSSTTNGQTVVPAFPNGTSQTAGFVANTSSSDPANASEGFFAIIGGQDFRIASVIRGTGTYLPMTFFTGGSERMRLDTSGNLGVGVTPTYKLDVVSGTADVARFTVLNKNIDGIGNIQVFTSDNQAANVGGSIALGGKNGSGGVFDPWSFGVIKGAKENSTSSNFAGYLAFATANSGGTISERMRIDSSGNVGIGTASPTFKLVAANSATDGGWMYSSAAISILGLGGYANAGDGAFQIQYNRGTGAITFNGGTRDTPSARISIDNTGNVTIPNLGSTSANITTLTGTTFGTTATTQLRGASAQITTLSGTSAGFTSLNISNLSLGTTQGNTKEFLTLLTTSGNADYLRHFAVRTSNGSDWTTDGLRIQRQVDATWHAYIQYGGGNNEGISFGTGGSTVGPLSVTERMRIDSSGNVGIGKSPTTKLDVSGTITGTAVSATNGTFTSATVTNLNSTSANITTLTGTTFGTTTGTTVNASTVNVTTTGTTINSNGDIYAIRAGGTTGVIYFGNSGARYLYYDGGNYFLNGAACYINGVQAVTNSGTWGISISGNAATVTNGLYTTGNQTITARTIQQGSQSVGSMLTATGSLGGFELYGGGGGNAAFMTFHRPGIYASYFGLDTDNQFAVGGWSAGGALANFKCLSLGVGTAASGTSGEIRATNNVTAYYSDARLKDFKGKIGGALDKVSQLNGYYYTENTKAEEFGFKNKELQVGVSAQEVQAVLPEIVTAAPFDIAKDEDGNEISKSGENYMTVRYERLVPLLIEAIKELKAEVEALKANKS